MVLVLVLASCPVGPDGGTPPDGDPAYEPEVTVYANGSWTANGGVVDLGPVVAATSIVVRIRIENQGLVALMLTDDPCITVTGPDADLVAIEQLPATSVPPGQSTTCVLRVSAPAAEVIQAAVGFSCNDPDEGEFGVGMTAVRVMPSARLPRTGQSTSYATGDDGEYRTGGVWPDPRFVDNSDGTVTDLLTGLMWQAAPSSSAYTWDGAVAAANASTLGGYEDWRLANTNELLSLANAAAPSPAAWLNADAAIGGVVENDYWTSTLSYEAPDLWAWVVHMDTGVLGRKSIGPVPSAWAWHCRDTLQTATPTARTGWTLAYRTGDDGDLQAGVGWPAPRFVDSSDGTVTDALTGLTWAATVSETPLTWGSALAWAQSLETGGYTDWRLPNRNELRSLVSYGTPQNHERLTAELGVLVPAGWYWSSTTYAPSTTSAWGVAIATGHLFGELASTLGHALAVRGTPEDL